MAFAVFFAPGTTSACAENTLNLRAPTALVGNYLRVRGEYSYGQPNGEEKVELPPRARRIPDAAIPQIFATGTTSACAENTVGVTGVVGGCGNYLRVRGEYCSPVVDDTLAMELPPRARRIHRRCVATCRIGGTTSACAENTLNELGLL